MLNPNEKDAAAAAATTAATTTITTTAAAVTPFDAPGHDATISSASQWLPSHLE